jgi:hypothetical protein
VKKYCFALNLVQAVDDRMPTSLGTESAGINRHIVGEEEALRKRRSDSIPEPVKERVPLIVNLELE